MLECHIVTLLLLPWQDETTLLRGPYADLLLLV